MALQSYMSELMEESGAQTIIVITDDVINHSIEKHASLWRLKQQGNLRQERRDSKSSQENDVPSPLCHLRRESSGSLQTSLVSMNDSPNRGQFCYNKRSKGEMLDGISQLPLEEQSLPESTPPLKRKPCIYEPRNAS